MANFNKVILLGNLTRDPEARFTQSGLAITKFGMAINRRVGGRDGGEQKEETCFVDITAFGKQAELISQYLTKGSPIFLEGRLQYSTWEAKDGGGKRSKLEVVCENFQFMGGREGGAGGGGGGGARREQGGGGGGGGAAAGGDDFDGIPF